MVFQLQNIIYVWLFSVFHLLSSVSNQSMPKCEDMKLDM